MSFGFKTINDNGNIQIDDTYPNFAVVQKGSISLTKGNQYFVSQSGGNAPLIAWTSYSDTSVRVAHIATNINGSTWTFTLYAGSNGSIDYYVFDNPKGYSLDNGNKMGMRIWNASAQPVFDTGYSYINVTTSDSVTAANDTNTYSTQKSLTPGRNYATCNITVPVSISEIGVPGTGTGGQPVVRWNAFYFWWCCVGYSGGYSMERIQYGGSGQTNSPVASVYGTTGHFLVFDVTGV